MRQRVVDVLEDEGPELPIVVLARRLAVPPTRLVPVLDDLYDDGVVTPGRGRGTVALAGPCRARSDAAADQGQFRRGGGS